ncbi:hypothetical protein ACRJ4W_08650 [Streptomyces sp. GLT-R25]
MGDGTLPRRPLVRCALAVPEAVAETAESLVRSRRTPTGEYGAERNHAQAVRTAIDAFGSQFVGHKRWWPSVRRRYCSPD